MSREIKFRAWDTKTEAMLDWSLVSSLIEGRKVSGVPKSNIEQFNRMAPDNLFLTVLYQGNPFKISDLILMQYTGLKDNNGVEIYEGDIVKFKTIRLHNKVRKPNEKARPKWFISAVVWDDCAFVISETQENDNCLWVNKENMLKVIGNIYENPELLNAK